jgi:hypothetical protein
MEEQAYAVYRHYGRGPRSVIIGKDLAFLAADTISKVLNVEMVVEPVSQEEYSRLKKEQEGRIRRIPPLDLEIIKAMYDYKKCQN